MVRVTGAPAELSELAAEFPGYEFATQETWEGVSIIATRHGGCAHQGLYAVVTGDLDEMRRALLEHERSSDQGDSRRLGTRALVLQHEGGDQRRVFFWLLQLNEMPGVIEHFDPAVWHLAPERVDLLGRRYSIGLADDQKGGHAKSR